MANGKIISVGGTYKADWIAASSSAYATNLSELIYLDPGTYLAIVTCPIVDSGAIPIRIQKTDGDADIAEQYTNVATYAQMTQPVKVLTRAGFQLRSFSSTAATFSYIDRGGMQFVRIA